MTWILLVGLVLVVTGGAFAGALAINARRAREAAIELVPGVASRVPTSWAGAHTPEARAYRRLVEAARAGRSAQGWSGGDMAGRWAEVEREALAVEARLLAASAVPGERRSGAVADAVALVECFESMVADVVLAATDAPRAIESAADDLAVRLAALREARLEVERIDRNGRVAE